MSTEEEQLAFEELSKFDEFTIEQEPRSLFYKSEDRYDGAINAYKIKNKGHDLLEPVIFGKSNKVTKEATHE